MSAQSKERVIAYFKNVFEAEMRDIKMRLSAARKEVMDLEVQEQKVANKQFSIGTKIGRCTPEDLKSYLYLIEEDAPQKEYAVNEP